MSIELVVVQLIRQVSDLEVMLGEALRDRCACADIGAYDSVVYRCCIVQSSADRRAQL